MDVAILITVSIAAVASTIHLVMLIRDHRRDG